MHDGYRAIYIRDFRRRATATANPILVRIRNAWDTGNSGITTNCALVVAKSEVFEIACCPPLKFTFMLG